MYSQLSRGHKTQSSIESPLVGKTWEISLGGTKSPGLCGFVPVGPRSGGQQRLAIPGRAQLGQVGAAWDRGGSLDGPWGPFQPKPAWQC